MKRNNTMTLILAAATAVVCLSILHSQEAMAQGRGAVDSFFDITYTVHIDAKGGIGVKAVGVTHSGERAEVQTDVVRVIRAGSITKIYVNHPDEQALTEIELYGDDPEITGLKVVEPKKRTHRGHVTVLK